MAAHDRRVFLGTVTTPGTMTALGDALTGALSASAASADRDIAADAAVRALYESLSAQHNRMMCFDRDRKGYSGFPLRLHVTNNWAASNVATDAGDGNKEDRANWVNAGFVLRRPR
jgi:hypothetical protein